MRDSQNGRKKTSGFVSDKLREERIEKKRRKLADKNRKRMSLLTKFKIILAAVLILAVVYAVFQIADMISKSSGAMLTDAGLTHQSRYRGDLVINGIDVSIHQGENIKWEKVKSSGADFAFVRAGYRDAEDGSLHEDSRFEDNIEDAHKAGLMTGAYFFSQAVTPEEAKEEAEMLLDLVDDLDIDLPLVIDFEMYEDGRLAKLLNSEEYIAASQGHDIVLAFCRTVEEAGYESAIYANYDMFAHYMDAGILAESTNLWLAQYGGEASLDTEYLFWQCADNSQIGGIHGNVDHNIWYIDPDRVYPTFAAGKGKDRTSIGDCVVHFNKESYKLKHHRAVPKVSLTCEGRRMRRNKDYTASVINNTASGTGYVIVRGKGRYQGWKAVPFTIE